MAKLFADYNPARPSTQRLTGAIRGFLVVRSQSEFDLLKLLRMAEKVSHRRHTISSSICKHTQTQSFDRPASVNFYMPHLEGTVVPCSRNELLMQEYKKPCLEHYVPPKLRLNRTLEELEAAVALVMLSEEEVFFLPKYCYEKFKTPLLEDSEWD